MLSFVYFLLQSVGERHKERGGERKIEEDRGRERKKEEERGRERKQEEERGRERKREEERGRVNTQKLDSLLVATWEEVLSGWGRKGRYEKIE